MIVFDMEWNSGRYEKVRLNEILQISAVKVEGITILDTFNAYIRPKAHKRFSPPAQALPALEDCLRSDLDFSGAMARFLAWCGEDRLFGTWGENDFQTLKENLLYWKVEVPLPDTFLDLQAGFCATVGAKGAMALLSAVEYCRIPDIFDFHDARNDALYTALVSQYITPEELENCRRVPGPPGGRKPSAGLPKGRHWKGPFKSREELRSNRGCRLGVCPVCGTRTRVSSWAGGVKGPYYAPFTCPDHGPFLLRLDTAVSATGYLWGSNRVLEWNPANENRLRTAESKGEYPCRNTSRRRRGRYRPRKRK